MYIARSEETGGYVAAKMIKLVDEEGKPDARGLASYANEAAIIRAAKGPANVIELYDAIQTPHYGYLFMEQATYGSMRSYFAKNGPLHEQVVKHLFRQLLAAINVSISINVAKTQY